MSTKLFSEPKLVTDNLLSIQQPTEKQLKIYTKYFIADLQAVWRT